MNAAPQSPPTPQPGDWADHRSGGLDPRRVTRLTEDGTGVYLDFSGHEGGPFSVGSYRFSRDPDPTPRAVQEFDALSLMGRAMLVASRLVQDAEAAGIELIGVSFWTGEAGLTIEPRNPALAPALAVALGLTERRITWRDEWTSFETFSSERHGIRVRTQHTIPTAALAADEPEQVAS